MVFGDETVIRHESCPCTQETILAFGVLFFGRTSGHPADISMNN